MELNKQIKEQKNIIEMQILQINTKKHIINQLQNDKEQLT